MRTASVRIRGIRFGVIAAIIIALCSWWAMPVIRRHIVPAITQIGSTSSEADVSSLSGLNESGRPWLAKIMEPQPLDPKARALSQLEDSGMPFTADGFIRAVGTGHRPLIDLFVTAGININTPSSDGRTALVTAALAKDWVLFEHLHELGADVNLADGRGVTPLMAAAMADRVQMIHLLLSENADVQAVDQHQHAAVHYAVATRNVNALNALIDAGANLDSACCEEGNLLAHAMETQDWRLVEPILKRVNAKLQWTEFTRGEFAKALSAFDTAKTRLLLSRHTEQPTPVGSETPTLAHTIVSGDVRTFKFLLDCGADPNTELNSPVDKDFCERVTKPFLKHYVSTEEGMTVLMLAAGLGQADFVKGLLDKGATRGLGTKRYKMPALLFATRSDSIEVAQMLIEGSPKPEELRVQISLGGQRASIIKNGAAIFSTDVSTGKVGYSTPPGNYVITDKHLMHKSTIYKVPMPFFMRLNGRDFGMHEGVVPGYPASHGCIRLPGSVARRLFKELPMGTLVAITP